MTPRHRVMVVGGTGFVGAHIADVFARRGHAVTTASRRPASASRFPHTTLDLRHDAADAISRTVTEHAPDVIVNAAGDYWGLDDDAMRVALLDSATALLGGIARSGAADSVRLVHLGTVMEYAPTAAGESVSLGTPTGPLSGYGRVKLAATEAVLDSGLDAVVLRSTNTIGPRAHAVSLLGKVARALRDADTRSEPARISLSPLQALRDYLDVRDLGGACVAAAESSCSPVAVPVGRGQALPVRHLVDRLIEISGVPAHVDEDEGAPRAPGSAATWLCVDPEPAATILDWRAERSVDDALADLWASVSCDPVGDALAH